MSEHNWQPGDVAMVTLDGEEWHIGFHCGTASNLGWEYIKGDGTKRWTKSVFDARRVFVIDPQGNPEGSSSLNPSHFRAYARYLRIADRRTSAQVQDWLADQIEAQSKPPKPEEPMGLGAVVEDAEGVRWVRIDDPPSTWAASMSNGDRCSDYAALAAVRVLSEGVAQ